ncbi:DUF7716 domain-containing protein [Burkholderia multivorans]|uniref:DUF7716 domain-containing protein n=1 Tax=Burkholderia multivorans TaxID=87883 RepID=UPI0005B89F49|nr:hypothetical protein [Burkholderia multivorans]MBJ9657408.1 hypothetical protein [Burkholderia multivorans]MBU9283286.1 hypothetical protein [Burkholderia multivorans]MBU9471407.1 hypothetical protein [Burkholderia multivorans]MBU9608599.1 hypothetical protein [Burkholderia multivorans]MBU9625306.1 hypothetical protein [Burkholderia multivorans]
MNGFVLNTFYKLDDLIALVRDKWDRDAVYMVYVEKDTEDLRCGMDVYVGDVPDFDDEDNEVLPESVTELALEQGCMREHLQDVVDLAYIQKPTASIEEIVQCLNHYSKYDDFMDLR